MDFGMEFIFRTSLTLVVALITFAVLMWWNELRNEN